ncbi:MAG: adenylate kinase [Negativicutes bacterium]|nr:adenylate kinase [Negativicutes bacterium]
MFILLMGSPGAGKGTQAERLMEKYNVPHISTGDIFRAAAEEGTVLGLQAKERMDKGQLVSDEVTIGIVKERLAKPDCQTGFILDGFPRTLEQAMALDVTLTELDIKLDQVVNIVVPDEELVRRLTGRRMCKTCGATYHVLFNPPEKPDECNKCHGPVVQRDDDQEETVKKRLTVYWSQTQPVIEYYRDKSLYTEIDGLQPIDKVFEDVESSLRGGQR